MNTFIVKVEEFVSEYSSPNTIDEFVVTTELSLDEALLAVAPKYGVTSTKVETGFSREKWVGNLYGLSIGGSEIKTINL